MSEEQPSGTVAISVSVTAADAAVIAAKAKDMGLTIGQLEGPIRHARETTPNRSVSGRRKRRPERD